LGGERFVLIFMARRGCAEGGTYGCTSARLVSGHGSQARVQEEALKVRRLNRQSGSHVLTRCVGVFAEEGRSS